MARSALESMVRAFAVAHPDDAARALDALPPAEASATLKKLPDSAAAGVVACLAPVSAATILGGLGPEATQKLLAAVGPRVAAAILHQLEAAARESALAGLPEERGIRGLLQYPPDTAGSLMDPRITALRLDMTVSEAINRLRRAPRSTLFYLYVTDGEGKLAGVVNMRDLLLAPPRDPLAPLVNREIVSVPGTTTRDELSDLIRERRFVALPVVDAEGFLLGVVRRDELIQAIDEEVFGDFQKLVGAGEDERALSPVGLVVRKRLPWLYVNLGTAFLAAAVVGVFEGTIEKVTALAVLLPVVAGQGGNTGAQALAVVMRGIALRELLPGSTRRLLFKETLAAFINGVGIAVGTGAAVWFWDGRIGLVLIIFLAMIVNMTAAGLTGAAIPLLLRAAGRDPAQSASIFLTTVTDIVGFAAFLGFAVALMPMLG